MKCYNRFDNNYNTEAFSALRVSDETGREWYPDSGATNHVTSSASGLQQISPYEGADTIMVGDGAYLPITHIGSTNITTSKGTLPLNEVLVCPKMKKSLMSVSKLCDDYPCGVYFDSNKVCVIDLRTQKVVSKGPRTNGFYMLKNQECEVFYSDRQTAASEATWHHRLAHTNFKILQQLHASKDITINKSRTHPLCEP